MSSRPSWYLLIAVTATSLIIGAVLGHMALHEGMAAHDVGSNLTSPPDRPKSGAASRERQTLFDISDPRHAKLAEHLGTGRDTLEEIRILLRAASAMRRMERVNSTEMLDWLKEELKNDAEGTINRIANGDGRVAGGLYMLWRSTDPVSAKKWLEELQGNPVYARMLPGILKSALFTDPLAALRMANSLESEQSRVAVWMDAVEYSRGGNEEEFASLFDETDFSPGARAEIEQAQQRAEEAAAKRRRAHAINARQRNAQNIASVAASAQAAGLQWNDSSLDAMVNQIVEGATVPDGPFEGTFFGVPNLSAQERAEVRSHLTLEHGVLKYHREPVAD